MNRTQRDLLAKTTQAIADMASIVESMRDEETDKYENLSEGLQASEKGQALEEAAEALSNAHSCLEDAIAYLEELL